MVAPALILRSPGLNKVGALTCNCISVSTGHLTIALTTKEFSSSPGGDADLRAAHRGTPSSSPKLNTAAKFFSQQLFFALVRAGGCIDTAQLNGVSSPFSVPHPPPEALVQNQGVSHGATLVSGSLGTFPTLASGSNTSSKQTVVDQTGPSHLEL